MSAIHQNESAFVYCGPAYGRPHHVLDRRNGRVLVSPKGDAHGKHSFWAPECDVETMSPPLVPIATSIRKD